MAIPFRQRILNGLALPFKAIKPRFKAAVAWAKSHRPGIGRAAFHLGLVGSFAFIVLLVHRAVYTVVLTSPKFRMPDATAKAQVCPPWTDPRNNEGWVTIPADHASLFEGDLVDKIAKSFEQNPWVRRVTAVERVYPSQVRVKFEMREARIAVRKGASVVLVDRDGVRLPGLYQQIPASVMELCGVASQPPASGRKWDTLEIQTGLEMASLVEGEQLLQRFGVRAVDLSNLNGRRDAKEAELAMRASSGAWIFWGRSPSSTRFGEPSLAEKLDNLRLAAENYPNLEGLSFVKIHQKGSPRCKPAEGLVRKTK